MRLPVLRLLAPKLPVRSAVTVNADSTTISPVATSVALPGEAGPKFGRIDGVCG